jgi:drug/metabolite transporter (DMT)-like permease
MNRATWIGASTILMWATLPVLAAHTGDVPPFQRVAVTFAIAFVIGLLFWWRQGADRTVIRQVAPAAWLVGVGGLFGYHFLYFFALRHAPPAEVSLLNHLWPLLLVLLAGLTFPDQRLGWNHLVGVLAGLLGGLLLIWRGGGIAIEMRYAIGYVAALLAAVTWAGYSLLSRFFGRTPTTAVGFFCGVTALLGLISHLVFEQTVWPAAATQWLALFGLGAGPVGLAFFSWDIGMKHGDIRLLGALSYTIPLLSTLLLIIFGLAAPTWQLAVACLLIIGGAVIAVKT